MAANISSSDSWGGAAILAEYVPVSIFNATIARPSRGNGSGVKVSEGSLILKNTILAHYATGLEMSNGNATEDYNLFFDNGDNISTSNGATVTSGGHSLDGLDPLLADPAGGDYHLTALSPCINKGTSLGAPPTDLDDLKRPRGSSCDIGAYEYPGGEGASPAVDLLLFD